MSARYDRALKAISHIPHEQCMVSALHVGYELQEAERRIDLLESTLRRVVPGIGLKQCAVHGHEECRDCGEFWPRDVAQSECMVCIVRAALDEAVQHDA